MSTEWDWTLRADSTSEKTFGTLGMAHLKYLKKMSHSSDLVAVRLKSDHMAKIRVQPNPA